MPKYEFLIFITRCKSYRCPKSTHYISHENERVILLVFQLLYLNNELTDPIFLFPFLKEHRCRLHYILFFYRVNYFKFGISHQRTTLRLQYTNPALLYGSKSCQVKLYCLFGCYLLDRMTNYFKCYFQDDSDITIIKDTIIQNFKPLVDSSQLIVREDLFLSAVDLSQESLDIIRKIIIDLGENYPEFGERLPKHWIDFQEIIAELKASGERIVSLDRLKGLNSSLETPLSLEELDLLLSFMHSTGVILHFKDTVLSETVILDPKLIIDAMRCLVTCQKFAMDVWGKKEWQKMSTSGKLEETYIIKVWKKRNKIHLYKNRSFLLMVMEKLDLITRPRIYDKGHDVIVKFFYVPSMVKEVVKDKSEFHANAVNVTLKFHDILPPAVFNRLVCSCMSLWPVHKNELYDGYVVLESGLNHLLVIRRQFKTIDVSFIHKVSPDDIDVNLCRSVKQYICQSVMRIVSLYDTITSDEEEFYTIEYNELARSKHFEEVQEIITTCHETIDINSLHFCFVFFFIIFLKELKIIFNSNILQ